MSLLTVSMQELMGWVNLVIWPMIRISAMFTIAPLFGSQSIPLRIRVSAAVVISVMLAPFLITDPVPQFAVEGLALRAATELMIGLSMGFALQLAFGSSAATGIQQKRALMARILPCRTTSGGPSASGEHAFARLAKRLKALRQRLHREPALLGLRSHRIPDRMTPVWARGRLICAFTPHSLLRS